MNSVATPNLKAFAEQLPKKRIGILRVLWPTIQDCLTVGHSLRDIHKTLHLDGMTDEGFDILRRKRTKAFGSQFITYIGQQRCCSCAMTGHR